MGKLPTIKPLIGRIAPLMGTMPDNEVVRSRYRDKVNPSRAWYKTKRWQQMRIEVFVRDRYVCQRSGVLCLGRHPEPNSPVANHKVPHRGDPDLFWDIDNVETVTKAVHDSDIQSEERAIEAAARYG